MKHCLALVLFAGLCFAQSTAQIQLDATTAAQWRLKLQDAERKARSGRLSPAELEKERREGEAVIQRLRAQYADNPRNLATYDREYAAQLRVLQGKSPPPEGGGKRVLQGIWETLSAIGAAILSGIPPVLFIPALFIVVVIIGWVLARRPGIPPPENPAGPRLSGTYGTADYSAHITQLPNKYYPMTGVFFGKSSRPELKNVPAAQNPGAPIFSWPEAHTLVVARTRTGKFTRIGAPTLAKYFGSMIVVDPKGENAAVTARQRARWQGKDVHILNPWGELSGTFQQLGFAPATYNPLDILDRDDPNAVAIAQSLAGAICPREPKGKDAYWSDAAASLLTAVLLWLADQPNETKTLARAREIVTKGRKDLEGFLAKMAASTGFGGAISENAGPFVGLAPETYSGVLSNLAQHTKFLSDPQVKAATKGSTFSMEDFVRTPATLYLVIPPDRIETQRTWLRLVITAGMHTFKRARERAPHRCMFFIDEFPALGRLDELPREIATMAGYGVDFTLFVQGLDQLKAVYGESYETIVNNCAFQWFCNLSDLHSAEYLSKLLGKATVKTTSEGTSFSSGASGASTGTSTTHGETGRPLLMPDEILNLGRDTAILIHPETRPLYLKPVDYWELEVAFASLGSDNPFSPPAQFDPNPYRPR